MTCSALRLAALGLGAALLTGAAAGAGLEDPEATVAPELVVRAGPRQVSGGRTN